MAATEPVIVIYDNRDYSWYCETCRLSRKSKSMNRARFSRRFHMERYHQHLEGKDT